MATVPYTPAEWEERAGRFAEALADLALLAANMVADMPDTPERLYYAAALTDLVAEITPVAQEAANIVANRGN